MHFFKTRNILKAVASGQIISLTAVKDEVFSSKMIGVGYAITNHDGYIHAPVKGIIDNIFPTRHAITIESESGRKILIHMGLDTVELEGSPFQIRVESNQEVKEGTLLAIIDLKKLEQAQKDTVIIVVSPGIFEGNLLKQNQEVKIKDSCFEF
ncbi:PTS glucose transporter subunit IIA [Enterococcus faecium]|uniref:PTS glucose transporter subunit IIA n=1 Tax=Enterococcus faecium TaxID=1352 RepID=UPI0023A97298|nr:PTS glucose transporter subunit IIA [Enterococcus faecium]MDE5174632.1 PTS glucose transporter subunit IIA [Enterococcus faecium]